ncbi:MAG TPA: hypothetical protein VMT79_18115 [Candidatus Binatia bacterium]|nr:hypothetical protein [Candidatus Binatia bacterium]
MWPPCHRSSARRPHGRLPNVYEPVPEAKIDLPKRQERGPYKEPDLTGNTRSLTIYPSISGLLGGRLAAS